MIACVTFETVKVTDPIQFYEVNRAHIIHYLKDGAGDRARMYSAFYGRVIDIIGSMNRDVEVVEHNDRVSDFSAMLKTVLSIIQQERAAEPDCEIFVNISSGTSEYAAAAAIAAMMVPGTTPFSVGTREYTVSDDKIEELYFVDGKPMGLTKSTYEPRSMPSYSIDIPEEHLVRGLRILKERSDSKLSVTAGAMIPCLKEAGCWYRDTGSGNKDPSKIKQTEAVYYQRDFIAKWVSRGWAEKDDLRNRYIVTPDGENIIDTFYRDRIGMLADYPSAHPALHLLQLLQTLQTAVIIPCPQS